MNINGLYGTNASTATSNVGAIHGTAARGASSIPPAGGAAATATISSPGQLFSDLQQLAEQDPTKFKAVAAQLATSLQNSANQASGPQAKFLTNLANRLSQAAQTGSLQPTQGSQAAQPAQPVQAAAQSASADAQGHPHHHHHGGSSGSSGPSTEVQQALQSAMSILTQAMQPAGSTPASSTPAGAIGATASAGV